MPHTPGDRRQVHDAVGRAADGLQHHHGIAQRRRGDHLARARAALCQLHRALAGRLGAADALGVGRRDRGAARQREAERLDHARHGARRAHHHAGADRGREPAADGVDLLLVERAGAEACPQAAAIGAGAEHLALVVADHHRAGGQHDRRQVDARRRHHLRRQGLVAAADQDDRVHRLRADHLLGVHRHEVAQEHAGRMRERLVDRDGGEFHRQAAREHDAALDRFDQLRDVAVARVEVAVGVGDADDRPVERVVGIALGLDEGLAQEQREAGVAVAGQTFAQAAGHVKFLGWT